MTDYHHWFEKCVKSKNIHVHFFQMKVLFRIYLIVWIKWIVQSSQILLDRVCHSNHVRPEKNESCSFSDDRDTKHNEFIHYIYV